MVIANQLLSIVVVVPHNDGIPAWLGDLEEQLHHPIVTTTLATIHDHVSVEMPAALILTVHNDEHLDYLQTLHEKHHNRPAIILCVENELDAHLDDLVDLVIPAMSHPLLSRQIQQAIKKNKQRIKREAEIASLKQFQANHRQAMTDIELLKMAVVRNVSHELNTPLLQVKSAVALIAEDMENTTLVDYALRSTARLEAAVRNITQLAASLNDMQMSPLIIGDIIDSAMRDLRRTWEHKEHLARIHVTLDEKLPPALGNRQGISIVIQQLIDNALKFSNDRVEVDARYRSEHIQITVRDHGIGIPRDEISKIFDSFYQVDPKSTRQFNGTGVGLANVRLILDRHGVEIHVNSVKGKGSTFSFELPVARLDK